MQAIGYLSRREHSRQELRAKLLAALRQRERDAVTTAAAIAAHAEDVARALRETPANGIDDAFAPRETGNPIDDAFTSPAPARGTSPPTRARRVASFADACGDAGRADRRDAESASASDPETEVDQLLDWLEAHGYLSDARFVESRVHARASRQGATRIKHELARHGLALDPEQASALRETEFARAQAIWQRKFGVVATDARERARQARFLAGRGFAAEIVRRIVGGEDEY